NEIAGKFKISRPAISKNLRILVDSRLVRQLTGCVSQLISPVLVPVWSPEI
ncbi:MAG: ArsR family transcriptional regulator, partial [Ignavibacteria bacterium]|nr:ArsR family transcriptional regulator [Ignavibacteria bacterium]